MKYFLLLMAITFKFSNLNAQLYYTDKKVEGQILNAAVFKNHDYLNPKVKDIECFELRLKERVSSYYHDFYRQYSSKFVKGKKVLVVDMFRKTFFKLSELKKPFSVIDGCEDVRHVLFDIEKEKIIYDEHDGGCNS